LRSIFNVLLQEYKIVRFLIGAVIGKPRLTIAVVLLVLAALAATMTYSGVLVIGVLADYLGTSRFVAGLLLGVLFARLPWIRRGKPRIVGLLPKPVRIPLMAGLLVLCLLRFLTRGDVVSAVFVGMTIIFVLGFPWLKKRLFGRLSSSVGNFAAGPNASVVADSTVIEGEFRERKD
jgi:peptidoglycan/LPS O-acetylase OafA/YrhL